MADRDHVLQTETFKREGYPIQRRVFETIYPEKEKALRPVRMAKAIGLLMEHLNKKGLLKKKALDELLFQVVS